MNEDSVGLTITNVFCGVSDFRSKGISSRVHHHRRSVGLSSMFGTLLSFGSPPIRGAYGVPLLGPTPSPSLVLRSKHGHRPGCCLYVGSPDPRGIRLFPHPNRTPPTTRDQCRSSGVPVCPPRTLGRPRGRLTGRLREVGTHAYPGSRRVDERRGQRAPAKVLRRDHSTVGM